MSVFRTVFLGALALVILVLAGCSSSSNSALFLNVTERGSWGVTDFLALSSFGGNGQKYVYRANKTGGGLILLTRSDGDKDVDDEGGWQPVHSPDGQTLAFAARRNGGTTSLFMMQAREGDRGAVTAITSGAAAGEDTQPNWHPDGNSLIFATTKTIGGGTGGLDIAIVGTNGSGLQYLTNDPEPEQWPTYNLDGTKIAFQRGPITGPTDIIIRDVSSGIETNITDGLRTGAGDMTRFEAPAWGTVTDGEWIYLHSNRDGDFDIFRIKPDGSSLQQITNDQRSDGYPVIGPDGDRIMLTRDRELWQRDAGPGDGNERRITRRY